MSGRYVSTDGEILKWKDIVGLHGVTRTVNTDYIVGSSGLRINTHCRNTDGTPRVVFDCSFWMGNWRLYWSGQNICCQPRKRTGTNMSGAHPVRIRERNADIVGF